MAETLALEVAAFGPIEPGALLAWLATALLVAGFSLWISAR